MAPSFLLTRYSLLVHKQMSCFVSSCTSLFVVCLCTKEKFKKLKWQSVCARSCHDICLCTTCFVPVEQHVMPRTVPCSSHCPGSALFRHIHRMTVLTGNVLVLCFVSLVHVCTFLLYCCFTVHPQLPHMPDMFFQNAFVPVSDTHVFFFCTLVHRYTCSSPTCFPRQRPSRVPPQPWDCPTRTTLWYTMGRASLRPLERGGAYNDAVAVP